MFLYYFLLKKNAYIVFGCDNIFLMFCRFFLKYIFLKKYWDFVYLETQEI